MEKEHPIINCLGRYSESNLILLLRDDARWAVKKIWQLAGRTRTVELIADNFNLDSAMRTVRNPKSDGVLYRQIENLDEERQKYLANFLIDLPPSERGKFIFTTRNFEGLNARLLSNACKIRFSLPVGVNENCADVFTDTQISNGMIKTAA